MNKSIGYDWLALIVGSCLCLFLGATYRSYFFVLPIAPFLLGAQVWVSVPHGYRGGDKWWDKEIINNFSFIELCKGLLFNLTICSLFYIFGYGMLKLNDYLVATYNLS